MALSHTHKGELKSQGNFNSPKYHPSLAQQRGIKLKGENEMAKPGPKTKPRRLSLVKKGDQPPSQIPRREGKIEPPKKLTIVQQRIWDDYVEPSWWLRQCDALLCYIFVNLMAEYMRSPKNMVATRIAELRRSMAELHISSSEQARLGIDLGGGPDPAEKFFRD